MIHLDQALARMREYERMKMAAESNLDSKDGDCNNTQSASKLEGMYLFICYSYTSLNVSKEYSDPHQAVFHAHAGLAYL